MKNIKETIKTIKELRAKVTLPWLFPGNYPFDIQVKKPRESLSQHTERMPTSWHWDDGAYLVMCVNEMENLIAAYEELEKENEELKQALPIDSFVFGDGYGGVRDET